MIEALTKMELGLVELLRAAWIAGTLPILVASIPSSRLNSFHGALLGFAKRGKTMQSSSHKFTIPQRFFLHFYLVAVGWTTLLVLTTWFYAYRMVPLGSESLHYSMVASYLTGGSHILYMHKSHPTPVEHRYRPFSSDAHFWLSNWPFGSFYTAAPLSLCINCIPEVLKFATGRVAEFIVKGRDRMQIIEFDWWEYVNPLTKLGLCQWIGAAIFIWGWIHQHRCHAILGSLREHTEQTDEYVIPHGDWFEFVSSPHYLAEIVIYAGLLVASGGSDLTIWLLFGFVVANLVFAAAETQRWYLRKFDNYPRNRRTILPFVY